MKIGIDLGGTNYRIGLLDDQNNVVSLTRRTLETKKGKDIIHNIINDLKDIDMENIKGIGFCAPGHVDPTECTISNASNISYEEKIEIGKIFSETFHKPIFIDNDANCAGLAEATIGAGKDKEAVYYITISTGIGASYIIKGKIMHGVHGSLGEIGSCLLNRDPKIRLEKSSAGPAIAQKGREQLNLSSCEEVFDDAKQGNEISLKIIDETFNNLAFTLANIVYIADPECFVLGGGISNNFAFFYPILMKHYAYYAKDAYETIPILKASLQESGVIGAALLIE